MYLIEYWFIVLNGWYEYMVSSIRAHVRSILFASMEERYERYEKRYIRDMKRYGWIGESLCKSPVFVVNWPFLSINY